MRKAWKRPKGWILYSRGDTGGQEAARGRIEQDGSDWESAENLGFCNLREFTTPVYPDQGRARAGGSPVM